MLKYTQAVINDTWQSIKKLVFGLEIFVQITYIAYLAYALLSQETLTIVNTILLVFSLAYFIFFLAIRKSADKKETKRLKKNVQKIYKRSKLFLKFIALGISVYGLFITSKNFSVISLVTTLLTLFVLILQVIFEIVGYLIEKRVEYFKYAIESDFKVINDLKHGAENLVRKVAGYEEVRQEPIPTHVQDYLNNAVKEHNADKNEKKILKIKKFLGKKKQ